MSNVNFIFTPTGATGVKVDQLSGPFQDMWVPPARNRDSDDRPTGNM